MFLLNPFINLTNDLILSKDCNNYFNNFNSIFLLFLFTFGSNSNFSILISLSFILPLYSNTLYLNNINNLNNLNIGNFNYSQVVFYLLLLSILIYSIFNTVQFFIKLLAIFIYYFRTIYIYSDLPDFPFLSFLCCSFYFTLGCLTIVFKTTFLIISTVFYSFFSTILLLINNNSNDLNDSTDLSLDLVLGFMVVSIVLQLIISFVFKRRKANINKPN